MCGRSALNCTQRCPRAERMSALDSSAPKFCFNPRSMASRNDSGKTPGTSLAGTLPENGLTPSVPGMASPGVLGLGVVCACARDVAAPYDKTPASRHARLGPKVSLKGASLASNLAGVASGENNPSPDGCFGQSVSPRVSQFRSLMSLGGTDLIVSFRKRCSLEKLLSCQLEPLTLRNGSSALHGLSVSCHERRVGRSPLRLHHSLTKFILG